MDWLAIVGGLVILAIGAEMLIRGATALARRLGVSDLLIGLTLVGFGTSAPELVASIKAALVGSPGIAVGNVVGSNIINILLILGLTVLIAPFAVDQKAFRRDGAVVLIATIAAIGVSMTGEYGRVAGAGFLAALAAYILFAFLTERRAPRSPQAEFHADDGAALRGGQKSPLTDILLAGAGLVFLVVGAGYLVTGAINIAAALGVSETVIGLTIVAVGTSLPELVTSAVAASRGRSGLALGNVVGSNIYNIFGILGLTAVIHPIAAPAEIVAFDNWVMLCATGLLIVFATTRKRFDRLEGAVLIAVYVAYVTWLVINA